MNKFTYILGFSIGLLMLGVGLDTFYDVIYLKLYGIETKGKVIYAYPNGKCREPAVQFHTPDGSPHLIPSKNVVHPFEKDYPVGATVPVHYLKYRPNTARINDFINNGFCLPFIIISTFLMFKLGCDYRKQTYLEKATATGYSKEKLISSDPAYFSLMARRYPIMLVGVVFFFFLILHKELKNNYIFAAILVIFCVGSLIYWFSWRRSPKINYACQARQIYLKDPYCLYVSDIPKLFRKNTFYPIPFEKVNHINYEGFQRNENKGFYHIYTLSLKGEHPKFTNPIVFLELESVFGLSMTRKPLNEGTTEVANAINLIIKERAAKISHSHAFD